MSNTIYNGSYPSIAENYVYSSTGTSKVKTKSDAGSNTAKTSDTASIKDTSTVNNTKADGKVAVNGQARQLVHHLLLRSLFVLKLVKVLRRRMKISQRKLQLRLSN